MLSIFKNIGLHPELTINVARNNMLAVLATICGAIFIAQNLVAVAPISILSLWIICQILTSVFRLFTGYKLLKLNEENDEWRLYTKLFILSSSLVGICLGLSAILAEAYGSVEEQLFVFAILIGFSGGAVATLSPVFQSYIAHVLGIMVPQILVLFFQYGETDLFSAEDLERLLGILGLLYLIIIVRAGLILHGNFYESILLKQELAASKAQAESANKAKSKFLSSISHELRTPLHAIMGSSQMLGIDGTLDEQKTKFVELISQAGNHLLSLIDQILEFSKIEAGKLKLELTEVNLSALLKECDELMQPLASKHDINLTVKIPTTNITFLSDALRLKQVLLNLISNAIKYNKTNGQVNVTASLLTKTKIIISVKDTGFGIPEDKKSEVFISFNRLGRESGEQEGTGIGLVICKDLMEMMGGTIAFESAENEGSHFWVEIDTGFFNNRKDMEL